MMQKRAVLMNGSLVPHKSSLSGPLLQRVTKPSEACHSIVLITGESYPGRLLQVFLNVPIEPGLERGIDFASRLAVQVRSTYNPKA